MARKSKRDDLAKTKAPITKPHKPDPGRQPRIVGWLVLIVGGLSSWYWYRPLPDVVSQTVHSNLSSDWPSSISGPKSLWSEQNLMVPSTLEATENFPEPRNEFANPKSEEPRLIGAPKVTLVPLNEVQPDIREILKTQRVPIVPIKPDMKIDHSISNAPQVWTPDDQQSSRAEDRIPSIANWPDEGYVPPARIQKEQRRSAVKITSQIPPLLETGMKSIRTNDPDETVGTSNTAKRNLAATELRSTPEPARSLQFIRQPKREK